MLCALSHAATIYDNKLKQKGAPGKYVGNFDYMLRHGANAIIANATHCMAIMGNNDVIHKIGST